MNNSIGNALALWFLIVATSCVIYFGAQALAWLFRKVGLIVEEDEGHTAGQSALSEPGGPPADLGGHGAGS